MRSYLRGQDSNLRTRGSKSRISTNRNYPAVNSCHWGDVSLKCLAGIEPAYSEWKPDAFASRPETHVIRHQQSIMSRDRLLSSKSAEGEGVEPSRPCSSSVFKTVAIANWLALPNDSSRSANCDGLFAECVLRTASIVAA